MKKLISIVLVILWMIIIFVMSSFNANESSNQSGVIVTFIGNLLNINDLDMLSFIVRKLAHFTEYFILGMFVYNLIKVYEGKVYVAIIICILYALSDEIHQVFVPGREFRIFDIFIDSLGSLFGIFLYRCLFSVIDDFKKRIFGDDV